MPNAQSARSIIGWLLLSIAFGFTGVIQASELPLENNPLVIGAISHKAKKHIEFSQPLADYLAENLKDFGYTHGKVVVAKNVAQMSEMLRAGQVDLVSETVFSALELEEAGAEMFLRRWKNGVGFYSSLIFVRQGRGLSSLDDLKGRTIVFEDRESTSGYFLPASLLINRGYELVELSSLSETAPHDKIGYVFAKEILNTANEISISSWVFRGVVDAGAFSSVNWNEDEDLPDQFRKRLTILHESLPFPRGIMLIRPGMSAPLKAAIKELLLTAEQSDTGTAALRRYQKTRRFDELNANARQAIRLAAKLRDLTEAKLQPSAGPK